MAGKSSNDLKSLQPIVEDEESEDEEQTGSLCEARARMDDIPFKKIQNEFLYAAGKNMENMNLISRKERLQLKEMKETLTMQAKRGINSVKASMKIMHARYAKELDGKLNEIASVLTRIEHLQDELQEMKQWEESEDTKARIDDFLERAGQQKQMIEARIEKNVSDLNNKRANDETLFAEFSASVQQQVQYSLKALDECLNRAHSRREAMLQSKYMEVKKVLLDVWNLKQII